MTKQTHVPEHDCAVCGREQAPHVSVMTDGTTHASVCDVCRPSVTALFFIYGTIEQSVAELRIALGKPPVVRALPPEDKQ